MPKPCAPEDVQRSRMQFVAEGYLVLPQYFTSEEVDRILASTEATLQSHKMEIVTDSLVDGERTLYGLARNPESQHFKFNDLYLISEDVRDVALDPGLTEVLSALLGGMRPILCNTLTLMKGSGQRLHIDSLFMTPSTPHHLVAAWMAFEDVDPSAGPLVYYPGSHKIPLYRFRDGSCHANAEELPDWNNYIEEEIKRRGLEKKTFLARKGDIFLWHSDLVHGGGVIRDPKRTRRSLVCHYWTEIDTQTFPDWRLEPLNGGFWINRLPQPVYAAPDRFDDTRPFPEETYLRRNPDLRIPLAEGRISSGFAHYCSHGHAEGRAI
jgi:phytanoyl-CoA hydroxylase